MTYDGAERREEPGPPGGISCEEARERVYEYLDGELDADDRERIHRHLEACRRCYPYFDFERIFLDRVRDEGSRTADTEELRERIGALLEQEE